MAKVLKHFKDFPHDDTEYQLWWLGTVRRSPHIENSFVVKTYFRAVSSISDFINFNSKISFALDLPVEAIQLFRLGTIWKNGEIIDKGITEKLTISNVKFNSQETPVNSVYNYSDCNCFYTPNNLYPLGDGARQTKVLTFKNTRKSNSDHDVFVIPTSEIFRFEYANSSNLAHLLLLGEWSDSVNGIYNPQKSWFNQKENTHYIQLRQKPLNVDAPLVARFFFSNYARLCLNKFHKYFRTSLYNSGESAFLCYPPFEEAVDLVVHGKTLLANDRKIFLIYWIETSTSPFPFENLKRDRDNSNDPSINIVPDPELYGRPQKAKNKEDKNESSEKPESTKPISTDTEKTKKIQTIWEQFTSDRFLELKNVKITKNQKKIQTHIGVPQPEIDAPDILSMQGGGYGLTCLTPFGLSQSLVTLNNKETLPVDLETMRQVVEILKDSHEISVEAIRLYKHNLPATADSSYIQGWRAWCFIDGNSKRIRRQILIEELTANNYYFYLLELQRRGLRWFNLTAH